MPHGLFHHRSDPVSLSLPAAAGDFPDPHVLVTGGGYVAYATNGDGSNVRVRTSADLSEWVDAGDALPRLPGWVEPGRTWSPSVLARGDHHVLWYVAHHRPSGRQAISCATAPSPLGPFEDRSDGPTIFQADLGGSIDPSPFVDGDGSAYLLWKADSNTIQRPSTLWAQRLTDDGAGLVGDPTLLLTHDRPWEAPLIEAPCMLDAGDHYLLMYSAGMWNTDRYAIGLARAEHPLGPWTKLSKHRPWAASDRTASGPGGQEVFTTPDGRTMLAYHAWEPGRVTYRAGGARSLRIGQLGFDGDDVTLAPLGG